MDVTPDLEAWLLALRTPGAGPAALRDALQAEAGAIEPVLDRWRARGGAAAAWLRRPDRRRIAADLDWLAQPGHRLLRCTDADFPPWLEAIPDPPAALFVAGEAGLLLRPQVAIVGARAATAGGMAQAGRFAAALAAAGLVVTSGLADGIDAAAHRAALDGAAPTVAVVGTGPDLTYPARHRPLAGRIAAAGALVSEFPPGVPPRPHHFPLRNRLIAGLTLGTLVVEAGLRSGSLITARLAAEQGREVFALPGSIHHALARGCHRLIREGATLVDHPDDIVQALAPQARALGVALAERLHAAPPAVAEAPSDPHHRRVHEALGHDPVGLDELVGRTGLPPAELVATLLDMELAGVVEALPGNRYQRLP